MGIASGTATKLALRLESGQRRSQTIGARVTEAEESEIVAAAHLAAASVSEWARQVLLREARSRQDDPLFIELIATRMLLLNLIKPLLLHEQVSTAWIGDVMTMVRMEKRDAAQEVLQQYNQSTEKE